MAINQLAMLLVYLLVGGLIVYVAMWAMNQMALPQPWRTVVVVVVVIAIIVILFLLRLLGMA